MFFLCDGWRINFWKDVWCGEDPLCERFPVLYSLTVSKEAKVAEVWDNSRGKGAWNLSFVRPLND